MNLFKSVLLSFCAFFVFASLLDAQTVVTNETDFRTEMSGAGNINVGSSIYFTQPFQNTVNKNVIISLDSGVILDGSNIASAGQGFNFSGSTLTLTFGASGAVNGFSGAFTAANGSMLNFSGGNVIFRQNRNLTSDGGAFNLSATSAASFVTNSALFSLNTSTGNGGAVYLDSGSSFDVAASTIFFRNNSSYRSGGAIYASNGSSVSLSGNFMDFSGNTANAYGGALHASGGAYFDINADTVFFDNNSSRGDGGQPGAGGIAYASNSSFDFGGQEAYFYNSYALGNGGAFFASGNSVFNFNSASSTFAGNESGASGGAIYSESGSESIFNGADAWFDINTAAASGGAIYAEDGSQFTFSSARTAFNHNESVSGGAIYGGDSVFTFNGAALIFASNKASGRGGALYAENGAVFNINNTSTAMFRHNSAADGGAIYMAGSSMTLDNASFLNNSASGQGGAVYMDGVSSSDSAGLAVNALTSDVLFAGNTAAGKSNDIYMNKYGRLEFYADTGRKITLEGGIAGNADLGNSIVKTGNGILEFAGVFSNYKGDLKISAGTLAVKNDVAVSAADFEVAAGAVYSTVNSKANQVTTAGSAQIKGELNIDIDFSLYKADKIVVDSSIASAADGKADLDVVSSILNISSTSALGIGTNRITLIEAENGITGTFAAENFTSIASLFPAGTTAFIEYLSNRVDLYVSRASSFYAVTNMTHNQRETALSLDEISQSTTTANMSVLLTKIDAMANDSLKKASFDQLSGSFIANALTAGALRNGMYELYERMQPRYCQREGKISQSVWGQVYFSNNKYDKDENSADDFKINGYGIQAGIDLLAGDDSVGGMYVSYGYNDLKQGYDKAGMQDYGLGFYGGWFGEIADVKASVNGGVQNFDLKRDIKFAGLQTDAVFNTYSVRADGQIEFKVGLGGGSLELRPFVGLQSGYVMNEEIKEKNGGPANLIVDGGGYLRVSGLGGVGIRNISEKFNWYGKLYAGYLMAGTRNEFDGKFADNGAEMNIYGTETGAFGGGAGIGAQYNLNKQWSVYANANAGLADGTSGYYGNIGVNYGFCPDVVRKTGKKTKENAAQEQKLDESEKVQTSYVALKEDNQTQSPANKDDIGKEEYAALETETAYVAETESKEKPEALTSVGETQSAKTDPLVRSFNDDGKRTVVAESSYAPETYPAADKDKKAAAEPEQKVYAEPVTNLQTKKTDHSVSDKTGSYAAPKPAFQETASFVSDDHALGEAEKDMIKRQAQELKKTGYNKIVVRGHTDSTGDEAVNNTLSLQRAKAVREELIANGIDPERIEYVGYADRKPVASNDTESGMAMNRRTDIVVDEPAITPGAIYTASYFMTDGYNLPAGVKAKIKEQADEIKQIDYNEIIIEGHADSTGSDSINDPLSQQRAKTVYDAFIKNGIYADKMTYKGYGSKRPIDTNGTKEGRANNRRVEVTVK